MKSKTPQRVEEKVKWDKLDRKSLKLLPQREWGIDSKYKSVYIVPSGTKHDSGYMEIAIVGEKEGGELEVAAYPDDIVWDMTEIRQEYDSMGMRTDCSYPKGVLRFWGNRVEFVVEAALSSTNIKVIQKKVIQKTIHATRN